MINFECVIKTQWNGQGKGRRARWRERAKESKSERVEETATE